MNGHCSKDIVTSIVYTYEACSEIIETLAFYPEHIDLDKQIIIVLL